MAILFTAITRTNNHTYNFESIDRLSFSTIITRQVANIKDERNEAIPYAKIPNSLCYEYTTTSKVIRDVPIGAVVMCWESNSAYIVSALPKYERGEMPKIEDAIESLEYLKAELVKPFESPNLVLDTEWASRLYRLMSFLPHGYMPVQFEFEGKSYCIYKYDYVHIVHSFDDKDEYILV